MSRVNIKGWGCLCSKVRYVRGGAFGGKEGETFEMKELLGNKSQLRSQRNHTTSFMNFLRLSLLQVLLLRPGGARVSWEYNSAQNSNQYVKNNQVFGLHAAYYQCQTNEPSKWIDLSMIHLSKLALQLEYFLNQLKTLKRVGRTPLSAFLITFKENQFDFLVPVKPVGNSFTPSLHRMSLCSVSALFRQRSW